MPQQWQWLVSGILPQQLCLVPATSGKRSRASAFLHFLLISIIGGVSSEVLLSNWGCMRKLSSCHCYFCVTSGWPYASRPTGGERGKHCPITSQCATAPCCWSDMSADVYCSIGNNLHDSWRRPVHQHAEVTIAAASACSAGFSRTPRAH